jgi:hypothetical protein
MSDANEVNWEDDSRYIKTKCGRRLGPGRNEGEDRFGWRK